MKDRRRAYGSPISRAFDLLVSITKTADSPISLAPMMDTALRSICECAQWPAGRAFVLKATRALRHVPAIRSCHVSAASNHGTVSPTRSQWTDNGILKALRQTESLWHLCPAETPEGQSQTVVAVPILVAGETCGALAFFLAGEEPRCEDTLSVLRLAAAQIARVAEREEASRTVLWQADHDDLTFAANRSRLYESLRHEIDIAGRNGNKVAVMLVDLDRFKQVNDTLGHAAGDEILCEIASRLRKRLRSEDTLARFGSDEFVVVVPGLRSLEFSQEIAQGLLRTIEEPVTVNGQELIISTSIGIAVFPDHAAESDDLLKAAITAKCRIKQHGGNDCRIYASDMDLNAREHLVMEKSLRQALAREELQVYYQPQVDPVSNRITGVEALLRWRHPELGLVPPTRFIPLAEETGLIVEIGEWVLEEAVHQAAAWQTEDQPLRVSVNLSARQTQQRGLPAVVARVLESSGLPPALLEMELTESAFMTRGGELQDNLEALKKLGVRLAVDDFGTGYSSLAYLKRFPLDVLKVDRSFVRGIEVEEVDIAIVRALVELSHALGLQVVAEGVETEGQKRLLLDLSCDTLQGYLFSPPVPPEELVRLLDQPIGSDEEADEQKAA